MARAPRLRRSGWLALALACKPLVPEVWSTDAGASSTNPSPGTPDPSATRDAGGDGPATLDSEQQIAMAYPIAFSSMRSGPLFILLQLHLASADGKAIRRVSTLAHLQQPVWAPDGRSIAFVWADVFANDDRLGNGLYLVTPSGSETVTLIEQRLDHNVRDPSWAPDGERIAYAVEEPDQPRRSWTISRYGGQPQRLLAGLEESHWGVAWSRHDPDLIALLIDEGGAIDVWTVDLRQPGERQRLFTGGLTRLSDLRWSPDGARLAFSASPDADAGEDGNRDIFVIDVSTGELQRVTDDTAVDRFPAWSADGASLLIASDRQRRAGDTERDLFWTPLDASAGPRRIVTNGTNAWGDVYWPAAAARKP